MQSVLVIVVIGTRKNVYVEKRLSCRHHKFAVIGIPLVGNDVIKHGDSIAPLFIFYEIFQIENVIVLLVGSKGILYELNQLLLEQIDNPKKIVTNLNIFHSSGPSTSFIVAYPADKAETIRKLAHPWFHHIEIVK